MTPPKREDVEELIQRADHYYGGYTFFQTAALILELVEAYRAAEKEIVKLERAVREKDGANTLLDAEVKRFNEYLKVAEKEIYTLKAEVREMLRDRGLCE